MKVNINWTEQSEFFGLNYSTKRGEYLDYTFDIRYDYDGDIKTKPDCGLCLTIYFKGAQIERGIFGNLEYLTLFSETYLKREIARYQLPN